MHTPIIVNQQCTKILLKMEQQARNKILFLQYILSLLEYKFKNILAGPHSCLTLH